MKLKIFSVVLCVILLLSVLVVPSFALNPAEYSYRYYYEINCERYLIYYEDLSYDFVFSSPSFLILDFSSSDEGYIELDGYSGGYSIHFYKSSGTFSFNFDLLSNDSVVVKSCSVSLDGTAVTDGVVCNIQDDELGTSYSLDLGPAHDFFLRFYLYSDSLIDTDSLDSDLWGVEYQEINPPVDPPVSSPIDQLTTAWSSIVSWIITSLASVQLVFYNEGLTFLGVLAVVGVAIAVAFLIIGVVQKFLRLRG